MAKTALITGASRGIGAACAASLAADSYRVIINYSNNKESAERVAAQTGGTAVCADVSDSAAVTRMLEASGDIDVLVCCAGVAHYGLFTDITDEQLRRVMDVNVVGVINCCRAAIPGMVRKKSGCIITVSSVWGLVGASCEAVYSASKAAVIGLSKSLAKELAPSGIRVNCIAPGVVNTDMLSGFSPEELDELRGRTPLGRLGTAEDVARLARFVVSEDASFITGQVISPNGGFVIC